MHQSAPVLDWLVERVGPKPGDTVLDIAGGTGDLGFRIAERVGERGGVISSDFAPEMVELQRRLGEERGLHNVEYRVLDAERTDLADDSVDGVVCRWGYMLMADPRAAFAETRRVLKAGGRLAFAVWAAPDRNPWASVAGMTFVQRGHMPPPEPGAPGIFSMADPDRIRSLVTAAGFEEPELEELPFDFRYADAADFWDSIVRLAGPLARIVHDLSPEERDATRAAVIENMAAYRNEDGSYTAPAVSWVALTR
jgi:ubiquinone/menaquinone biosynthesis C-methylase UbiE